MHQNQTVLDKVSWQPPIILHWKGLDLLPKCLCHYVQFRMCCLHSILDNTNDNILLLANRKQCYVSLKIWNTFRVSYSGFFLCLHWTSGTSLWALQVETFIFWSSTMNFFCFKRSDDFNYILFLCLCVKSRTFFLFFILDILTNKMH